MLRAIVVTTLLAVGTSGSSARERNPFSNAVPTSLPPNQIGPSDDALSREPRFALAAANTTVLASFSFNTGGTCDAQGWNVVDATSVPGTFWHVDDFVGANVNADDSLAALAGSKSLWCGARAGHATCSYAVAPGYGNSWNQTWTTKACLPIDGNLDISFLMAIDTEPGFDAVFLEYNDCSDPPPNWGRLEGGLGEWDGRRTITHAGSYAVGAGPVQVRFRFRSDGAYSDEDGLFDSHAGAVIVDNLKAEGLATEDFEGDGVGATSSDDWKADHLPGFGSHFALFSGATQVQQDQCVKNLSCVWAAIQDSRQTYACGGFPQQPAVPMGWGWEPQEFIWDEIWSPLLPLLGTGSVLNLQFTVYRDLQLDGLVFYEWGVRSIGIDLCPTPWLSDGFLYYSSSRDWFVSTFPCGRLLDLTDPFLQARLGVVDMCWAWCGIYGAASCHSHAPLFDNVRIYRVDIFGPTWSVRDIEMFQDTFPSDGTDTGTGRADCAQSIVPNTSPSPTVQPGDSVFFTCGDAITASEGNPTGVADDLELGGKQCYIWVHVLDHGVPSDSKLGAALTDLPSQYKFKDTQTAFGKTWTRIQCELFDFTPPWGPITARFRVDLNDNLFEAGDVVEFFFGATNALGQTSYCSGSKLNYVQSDVNLAAELASEFTILPLNGGESTDILYVDSMDGRGGQELWDTAFHQIGVQPDRYDVRGPSSAVSNRPGSRVTNVAAQLNANYQNILWDCGDLSVTLGDAGVNPILLDKSHDFGMVNAFLDGLTANGGVYICGDDFPQRLNSSNSPNSVTFKTTHITYTLTTGNHRPTYGNIAPAGVGTAGGAFAGDTWVIYGGCPIINDFDVMTPTGASMMHSSYGDPSGNDGAEIAKVSGFKRTMISGYSLLYIRDDEADGTLDRARHLHDIITFLGGTYNPPTGAGPVVANHLAQNYPNPFNPQTTIAFSLKARGRVVIAIYNVAGQLVKTILDETRAAGSYTDMRWDGTDASGQSVASGVYLCRLQTTSFADTKKMVLLK
jgi:hypothetical protein